eukprot:TRINITY_DN62477_c0_g1_i1.p1 TRINITY_DN62477_c0_g1~~TRINITY_DN62477_c0_g1_i1.p1  ORF type:complete len:237 (+),score=27.99 TRINITY_DN62477_c0_g1_i1:36-746(+)
MKRPASSDGIVRKRPASSVESLVRISVTRLAGDPKFIEVASPICYDELRAHILKARLWQKTQSSKLCLGGEELKKDQLIMLKEGDQITAIAQPWQVVLTFLPEDQHGIDLVDLELTPNASCDDLCLALVLSKPAPPHHWYRVCIGDRTLRSPDQLALEEGETISVSLVAHEAISFQQPNPKMQGSRAHARYTRYSQARTREEAAELGGSRGDLMYDERHRWLRPFRLDDASRRDLH